jgi:hypothetical protein
MALTGAGTKAWKNRNNIFLILEIIVLKKLQPK